MKPQQIHNNRVSSAILNSVNPETFKPTRLTAKALSDDSCWEEDDVDFETTLPDYAVCTIDDDY